MSEPLFSQSWYRVASLKPRLRAHAHVHRHDYRDQVWYVLQDRASGRFHRFSPAAYHVIGLMDGERTVGEIWEAAGRALGDDAPGQAETLRLFGQLHAADVLQCDVPPDTLELFERFERQRSAEWKRRLKQPFAIRLPLFDPDRILDRWMPVVRPLLGWFGALVWLLVVGAGLGLAVVHWTDLSEDVVDRVLTPQNLLMLWLIYPVVKALHEFGHGFAVKARGGEVHEMGIMLLVFMPVPYVDASSASAFRDKRHRLLVGAAGILVELFLAALALIVWVNVEPGVVRAGLYNVMLIGGVSTLLFNGNPLLRFDGYYVLMDAVEIPNLGTRANKYIGYLVQRYVFGAREADSPVTAPGERAWFVGYGVTSFVYRMLIMATIVLFVATQFFLIGILLAIWFAFSVFVMPLAKGLHFVVTSPVIRKQRRRAVATTGAVTAGLVVFLGFFPMPSWTRAEGVIWIPEDAQVRAGTDGFVRRVVAPPGSAVRRGDPLIESDDPLLEAEVRVLESKRRELRARYDARRQGDRVQAQIVKEEMATVEADLARARERAEALVVRSPADGTFVLPRAADLPERFLRRGERVGDVVDLSNVTARVVVPQADIGLVRERTRRVLVRTAERIGQVVEATVRREVPGGTEMLPATALGSAGGGEIAIDPRDAEGRRALEKVFQLDIALPAHAGVVNVGGRIYVRFDHGREPLARQWYRRVRQLFLKRFGV